VRRFLLVSFLVVALVGTSAFGSETLPDRSHATRGWMYARVLRGEEQIQVLVRFCQRPRAETHCRRMSVSLQAHIGAESTPPIRWVHRRWPHAGTYWVFSRIRFGAGRAVYRYAWVETEADGGCAGSGRVRFRRVLDAWDLTGHNGVTGCPALGSPGDRGVGPAAS
jgi:hypothetical protein